jgi:hypothetical protein
LGSRPDIALIDVNVAATGIDVHTLEFSSRDSRPRQVAVRHPSDAYVSRVADRVLTLRRGSIIAACDQSVLLSV